MTSPRPPRHQSHDGNQSHDVTKATMSPGPPRPHSPHGPIAPTAPYPPCPSAILSPRPPRPQGHTVAVVALGLSLRCRGHFLATAAILSPRPPCPHGHHIPMATMSPWPPCPQDDHVPISTMSPWPPRPQGHTVAQGGLLLLGTLGLWVLEGGAWTLGTPPGTLNASGTPRWDLASAFFFSTTLLTTVGYGPVAPLSPGGKAFCLAYAALGVPFTVLTLAVVARWLSVPVTRWPRRYLRTRWGWSPRGAAGLHLGLLAGAVAGGFVLLPAAALWALGGSGSFLDAVFFCGMAVTTVGLGDAAAPEGHRRGSPRATSTGWPWPVVGVLMVGVFMVVGSSWLGVFMVGFSMVVGVFMVGVFMVGVFMVGVFMVGVSMVGV
eukprot:XP_027303487.1 two pore potassium channel c-like [Anas platyrhynchos]